MADLIVHVGDEQWTYDAAMLTNKDVRELEKFTGQRFSDFMDSELSVSDADHLTALVWLARRQSGEPVLKLDDVDFPFAATWVETVDDPTESGVDPTTVEDVFLDGGPTG